MSGLLDRLKQRGLLLGAFNHESLALGDRSLGSAPSAEATPNLDYMSSGATPNEWGLVSMAKFFIAKPARLSQGGSQAAQVCFLEEGFLRNLQAFENSAWISGARYFVEEGLLCQGVTPGIVCLMGMLTHALVLGMICGWPAMLLQMLVLKMTALANLPEKTCYRLSLAITMALILPPSSFSFSESVFRGTSLISSMEGAQLVKPLARKAAHLCFGHNGLTERLERAFER
ncbi:MAG: hypothetical protein EBX40_06840 [Gammaproteobacteria bacterium]|nr:hypothetical protein [Gammaproteobacteria bacterium]